MFKDVILDGANPGANLGFSFSANINATQIAPKGKFLDSLVISLSGAVATAPVVLENAVGALSQFTFKAGQETRIQLSLKDLIALMAAYYNDLPGLTWENTDNTGFTFVLGVRVPIQETIDPSLAYTYSANYTAVTNYTAVQLGLTANYLNDSKGRKPVIAVPIPYTTPGATGSTSVGARLTNLGEMVGLLMFQTTMPSDTGVTTDVQRIQLVESGKQTSLLTLGGSDSLPGVHGYQTLQPIGETLQPYTFWDFRDEPFNVKDAYMEFIVDVETTAEATRLIPIVEKA